MRFFSATVIAALFAMADARSPRRCYDDACRDGRTAYATCRWTRDYAAASDIDVWPRGYLAGEQAAYTDPVTLSNKTDGLRRTAPYSINLVSVASAGSFNEYTCAVTGTPTALSTPFTATDTSSSGVLVGA